MQCVGCSVCRKARQQPPLVSVGVALAAENESEMVKKHSKKMLVNGKRLRVVHIPHEDGPKAPLLVFVHGMGAQVLQRKTGTPYFPLFSLLALLETCCLSSPSSNIKSRRSRRAPTL